MLFGSVGGTLRALAGGPPSRISASARCRIASFLFVRLFFRRYEHLHKLLLRILAFVLILFSSLVCFGVRPGGFGEQWRHFRSERSYRIQAVALFDPNSDGHRLQAMRASACTPLLFALRNHFWATMHSPHFSFSHNQSCLLHCRGLRPFACRFEV